MKSKEELKEQLKPYLETYPDEPAFFITNDGTVFLSGNRNDGQNHANNSKSELHVFTREDFEEETPEDPDGDGLPDETWKIDSLKNWLTEKGVVFIAKKKIDLLDICLQKIAEEKQSAEEAAKQTSESDEKTTV